MENTANANANPAQPQVSTENTLDTIAKNRGIIPVAFALVILLFFFSFCDFKCNNMKVASLTGINLVTGSHVNMAGADMLDDNPFGSMNGNNMNKTDSRNKKVDPNIWAIIAFLTAIAGVVVFYKKLKNEALLGTAAGAIGVVSLLLLRSAIQNKLQVQGGGMVQVEIDFLFGYWASILAFLIAGGISYLRLRQGNSKNLKTSLPLPAEVKNTSVEVNTNKSDMDSTS